MYAYIGEMKYKFMETYRNKTASEEAEAAPWAPRPESRKDAGNHRTGGRPAGARPASAAVGEPEGGRS